MNVPQKRLKRDTFPLNSAAATQKRPKNVTQLGLGHFLISVFDKGEKFLLSSENDKRPESRGLKESAEIGHGSSALSDCTEARGATDL